MPRLLLFVICQLAGARAGADIEYLHSLDPLTTAEVLLFDARELAKCQAISVTDARCLPAETFIAADHSIASFYHIGWALGTHGLSSNETILVFSDLARERNLLAGILHLAGQRQVLIWQGDLSYLQDKFGKMPGRTRGITRQRIYQGVLREDALALIPEIEPLESAGWRLYRSSDLVDLETRMIVAGPRPAASIDAFVELSGARKTALKVVIDPYPGAQRDTGPAN